MSVAFEGLKRNHYGVVYADPAWRFLTRSAKGRGRSPDGIVTAPDGSAAHRHYQTMSLDEIAELPVSEVSAEDAVLLMWVTDPMLENAHRIAKAWGFRFSTVGFYWMKTRRTNLPDSLEISLDDMSAIEDLFPIGQGYWTRANPEQCLLFTKGKPKRLNKDVRRLMISPRREHSRKPDETPRRIERLVSGPYLELFSRTNREGWDSWGDQSGMFGEVG